MAKTALYGWQRCRIVRLHTKNVCTAFLLDIGISEHIKWIDLRLLDETWCHQEPFAIRCSLIDVVTANPIGRCTPQQHQQFTQTLQMYENFYISVNRSGTISSDIFLYYVLDNQFHCVNEMFPSDSSTTDDEDYEFEQSILSNSGTKIAVCGDGAGAADRGDGSTFIMNKRSAKQYKTMANETSITDENLNVMEKENTTTNDIEMKEPSECAVPKPLDQQRLSKPERIVVRHIDETGSVFVCFKKYEIALHKLRFEIQKHVGNGESVDQSNEEHLTWNVDDFCLVHGKFDGFTEWLRGKITNISAIAASDNGNLAQVYLRDLGKIVETPLNKLKPIPPTRNVRDFVWKSRLASIELKQRCGDGRIAKILKKMLNAYDEIAISVLEPTDDQLNIILWGITQSTSALLPEKIKLTNINEELVARGYAHTQTKFDGMNELITNLMNATPEVDNYDSDNLQTNSTLQSIYNVTDERMDVEEWLPSEPIQQREFAAFPMHVARKCILSILEANRRSVADEMKNILEEKNKTNELEHRDAMDWKKEDPCFVLFKADGRFYRGSVRRVNFEKNICMVS